MSETEKKKLQRGFAAMTPERQKEIASKGGKSVPAEKRSFSQDRDLARKSGRTGGINGGLRAGSKDEQENR